MAGWSISKDGSEENCTENCQSNELGDGCLSDSDNDVKWDDCDDKLRCLFDQVLMVLLRGVYAKNGIRPIPALLGDGRSVDLFKLFCLVRDRGGFGPVSKEKLWGLVAEKFGFNYKVCASVKLIYFKYLDELDQWLNRITRDMMLSNGSYECGGNLGLLSLELEKRFRDFSADNIERVQKDVKIEYDEICKHIDVALKETLHMPDSEKESEEKNDVIIIDVDDDDKLCGDKNYGKENHSDVYKDSNSLKRKRDTVDEMLSWMIKTAKNPSDPSIGMIPGCSRWKENGTKDVWSVALLIREARLQRRYADSSDEQSPLHQKKHKMHPSMYEDDTLQNQHSAEGLRSSKRIVSLAKSSPSPPLGKPCKAPPENGCKEQNHVNADLVATEKLVGPPDNDPPIEKHVSVGTQFQAEVPIWTGVASDSDSKWLGTQVWYPDFRQESPLIEFAQPGKGREDSCKCPFPGSVECHRFHIAERRMKLRHELGLVFYYWKFDKMGEEVSLSWSIQEEKRFKQIIQLNRPSLGKSFFPRKKWRDLVSYYYNVYLISRRSYQNRVTPKDIDSDDDEAEFGSVSEPFGYNAVKVSRSESLTCSQNEQVLDFD